MGLSVRYQPDPDSLEGLSVRSGHLDQPDQPDRRNQPGRWGLVLPDNRPDRVGPPHPVGLGGQPCLLDQLVRAVPVDPLVRAGRRRVLADPYIRLDREDLAAREDHGNPSPPDNLWDRTYRKDRVAPWDRVAPLNREDRKVHIFRVGRANHAAP